MYFVTQIALTIRCIMKAGAMLSMAPYTHVRITEVLNGHKYDHMGPAELKLTI